VRARGARNVHVAPQSVDNEFWSAPPEATAPATCPPETRMRFLFAGRPLREKGIGVLMDAWSRSGFVAPSAALVLAGVGSIPPWVSAGGAARLGAARIRSQAPHGVASRDPTPPVSTGVVCLDPVPPVRLRSLYAEADALVVPSIRTRTFREPWGLVVNEAMNRGLPVIATDAVGAVAGGLVRDEHNGLVVPAGDPAALAAAMRRLAADADLRDRLGVAGARDVRAYTHDAWAQGFSTALATLGLSRAGAAPAPAATDPERERSTAADSAKSAEPTAADSAERSNGGRW